MGTWGLELRWLPGLWEALEMEPIKKGQQDGKVSVSKGFVEQQHQGSSDRSLWTLILGRTKPVCSFSHSCFDSYSQLQFIVKVKLSLSWEADILFISLLVHLCTSSPVTPVFLLLPAQTVRTLLGWVLLRAAIPRPKKNTVSKAAAWCHGHQQVKPALALTSEIHEEKALKITDFPVLPAKFQSDPLLNVS